MGYTSNRCIFEVKSKTAITLPIKLLNESVVVFSARLRAVVAELSQLRLARTWGNFADSTRWKEMEPGEETTQVSHLTNSSRGPKSAMLNKAFSKKNAVDGLLLLLSITL